MCQEEFLAVLSLAIIKSETSDVEHQERQPLTVSSFQCLENTRWLNILVTVPQLMCLSASVMLRKYQVAEYTGDCSSVDVSVGLGSIVA
jgi:hypothetical protein